MLESKVAEEEGRFSEEERQALARVEQSLHRSNPNSHSISQRLLAVLADNSSSSNNSDSGGGGFDGGADDLVKALGLVQGMLHDERDLLKTRMVSQRLLSIVAEESTQVGDGSASPSFNYADDDGDDEDGDDDGFVRGGLSVVDGHDNNKHRATGDFNVVDSDDSVNPAEEDTAVVQTSAKQQEQPRPASSSSSVGRRMLSKIIGYSSSTEATSATSSSSGGSAVILPCAPHSTSAEDDVALDCVDDMIGDEDSPIKGQVVMRVVVCAMKGQQDLCSQHLDAVERILTPHENAALLHVVAILTAGSRSDTASDEIVSKVSDNNGDANIKIGVGIGVSNRDDCDNDADDADDDDDDDALLLKAKAASMRLLCTIMATVQVNPPIPVTLADECQH
jgi:hypothetical protein